MGIRDSVLKVMIILFHIKCFLSIQLSAKKHEPTKPVILLMNNLQAHQLF